MLTMSPLTRYLSRLLGVFLLVTAVSEWTQPALLTVVFPGLFDQPGLLWVFGMFTFASGLAIVLGHNDWSNNPAQVVSLLGWLMTINASRACTRRRSRRFRAWAPRSLRRKGRPAVLWHGFAPRFTADRACNARRRRPICSIPPSCAAAVADEGSGAAAVARMRRALARPRCLQR